ncbi:DUF342 domain-containing protein [Angelakisella massiliensis]|uniref:DUF342 domain-containing protein n=1 Tax=Angelakisella massiliensis TaxID=1871018 RepID=UPI0008F8AE44|nr:FapA family protein [Angelakisella massiliensis]
MAQMESCPMEQERYELTFPPNHGLNKLRVLWAGDCCAQLPLRLNLASGIPQGVSLPVKDLKEEMKRLTFLIDYAAQERLREIFFQCQQKRTVQLEEGSFIFVSSDKMAAWLLFFPPVGMEHQQSKEEIQQQLSAHGVVSGIKSGTLERLQLMSNRYFYLFLIATGTMPVPGRDGYVEEHYPRTYEQSTYVHVEQLDQMDYEDLHLVQDIRQGEVICEIFPPTAGVPGRTVTGEVIAAQMGCSAQPPQGRNTQLSADGRFLVASQPGHLGFSGRCFQVKPVLHISQQELEHPRVINFLGDIHIHGDLSTGFSIRAIGNVQIDGVMEGCSVEAGENIIVSSGVQGQGRAVLHAHQCIYAKYLEQCTVYGEKNVYADCMINCEVYCNGTVQVSTGRGVLIGGTIRAAQDVIAAIVGTKTERCTHVILGGKPCEEAQKIQLLKELETINKDLAALERQPKSPQRDQKLSKLHLNQYVAEMKLEKFEKELEALLSSAHDEEENIGCFYCRTVYPGTNVTIGHDTMTVDALRQNCAVGLKNGWVGYL